MVAVVRVVGVIHGGDIGHHRRPDIVVVIGRDAHELRAFDQKGGMPNKSDPHLIRIERRQPQRRRHQEGRIPGHEAGAILAHFRRRRLSRLGFLRLRQSGTPWRAGCEGRGNKERGKSNRKKAWRAQSAFSSQQRRARQESRQIATEGGAGLWPAPGV